MQQKVTRHLKASMTVEAAMVLPIFLIIVINLLSLVDMLGLYAAMEASLHQTGREMAINMHAYDLLKDKTNISDENGDILELGFREGYARAAFLTHYSKENAYEALLTDGKAGITFYRSDIMNADDIIDLAITYRVTPYLNLFGIGNSVFLNRCRIRAWTGYDVTSAVEQDSVCWVYITENNSVYHTSAECTHLDLTIKIINDDELLDARNADGSKYKPCAFCAENNKAEGFIYISEEGDHYHYDRGCSGLKRTVTCINLAEIGNLPCCQRCMENGGTK